MKHKFLTIAFAAFVGSVAQAQSTQDLTPAQKLAFSFGPSGLLLETLSNETYGNLQLRQNQGLAQNAVSAFGGPASGYEDVSTASVLPVHFFWSVPGSSNANLRFSAISTNIESDPNLTQTDSEIGALLLQYWNQPNASTAWGLGVMTDISSNKLQHNGGDIETREFGLRADILHQLSTHWGVAGRVVVTSGTYHTEIPAGASSLEIDQDAGRVYLQGNLVGTYSSSDIDWLPEGWVLQPNLEIAWQRLSLEATMDSFGGPVPAGNQEFGVFSASIAMSKPQYQPMNLAPVFEVGLEHEFTNDLGRFTGEETYFTSKVGVGMNLNQQTRFDAVYSRLDGLSGSESADSLTLAFTSLF